MSYRFGYQKNFRFRKGDRVDVRLDDGQRLKNQIFQRCLDPDPHAESLEIICEVENPESKTISRYGATTLSTALNPAID